MKLKLKPIWNNTNKTWLALLWYLSVFAKFVSWQKCLQNFVLHFSFHNNPTLSGNILTNCRLLSDCYSKRSPQHPCSHLSRIPVLSYFNIWTWETRERGVRKLNKFPGLPSIMQSIFTNFGLEQNHIYTQVTWQLDKTPTRKHNEFIFKCFSWIMGGSHIYVTSHRILKPVKDACQS